MEEVNELIALLETIQRRMSVETHQEINTRALVGHALELARDLAKEEK